MLAIFGVCLEHRIVIHQGSTVTTPTGLPRGREGVTAKKTNTGQESELAGHARAECGLREHLTLGRYLRRLATGRLPSTRPLSALRPNATPTPLLRKSGESSRTNLSVLT